MKKKSRVITMLVLAVMAMSITASAYYAYVTASHNITSRGANGFSTIEATTDSGLTELYSLAAILDDDGNEYAFGQRTLTDPTVSVLKATAIASGDDLSYGSDYYVQAYGHIKYMTKYGEQMTRYTDEDYFTYRRDNALEEVNSERDELRNDYIEERANYIFEQFGYIPQDYTFVCSFDLLNYVDTDQYLEIREAMNIQPGTTTPCFFIDDGTIFGVCQDKEALSSLYTFTKDNGGWLLADTQQNQEDGCYQDICQSFPEFQMEKNSKN